MRLHAARTIGRSQLEALEARRLFAAAAAAYPAPDMPDLDAVTDTGSSRVDDLTNLNNASTARSLAFTVLGTAPDVTVTLYADGLEVGRASSVNGSAHVITRGDAPLSDGVHLITARQGRASPEESLPSRALRLTIDTTPPAAPPAPDLQAASDTGPGDSDNVTADNSPTFDVAASEPGRLYLEVDGGRSFALDVPAAGVRPVTVDDTLSGFSPPRADDVFSHLGQMTAADVNGDGSADVIGTTTNRRLVIMLGNGDGTFRPPQLMPTVLRVLNDVAVGDFNGDGKVDLGVAGGIVFGPDPNDPDREVQDGTAVYLGNGDGTFAEHLVTGGEGESVWHSSGGSAAAVADFNRDGHADFVSGHNLYLGHGDGTFDPGQLFAVGTGTYRWILGDFNHDQLPDLAGAGLVASGGAHVFVVLGNGDGTFRDPVVSPGELGPFVSDNAAGDFNGDGNTDLVVTNDNLWIGSPELERQDAKVLLGNGDGTFTPAPTVPLVGLNAVGVTTGDFDGDGLSDFAATARDRGQITVALSKGDGTFRTSAVPAGSDPKYVVSADFNRDGLADLAAGNETGFSMSTLLGWRGPLADGTHAVAARLEDAAGNVSAPGEALAVTVDSTQQLVAEIVPVAPDPHPSAVDAVRITFNRPVTGFDPSDLALARDGGTENLLTAAQTLTSSNGGRTWTLGNLAPVTATPGDYALTLGGSGVTDITDDRGHSLTAPVSEQWRVAASLVFDRRVFYNDSLFDGRDPAANLADVQAAAPDKYALRPGDPATYENVTNYTKGINGVLIDFIGPPPQSLTADDFDFRVGAGNDPAQWAAAPPAAVTLLPEVQGPHDLTTYAITFPDGAIRNTWLRVTVNANDRTRLARPDVFYFGNLVGDTGRTPGRVDAVDFRDVMTGFSSSGQITIRQDFNRDGWVNALDLAVVRGNLRHALPLISAPRDEPPAAATPLHDKAAAILSR